MDSVADAWGTGPFSHHTKTHFPIYSNSDHNQTFNFNQDPLHFSMVQKWLRVKVKVRLWSGLLSMGKRVLLRYENGPEPMHGLYRPTVHNWMFHSQFCSTFVMAQVGRNGPKIMMKCYGGNDQERKREASPFRILYMFTFAFRAFAFYNFPPRTN